MQRVDCRGMLTACVGAGKEIGVLLQHGGDHGSQAIESLTHVNGTAAQIDLRTGRDVQDHETLFNAISTRPSTRSLMKASVRTRAPFGRSISMTPVRSSSLARSAAGVVIPRSFWPAARRPKCARLSHLCLRRGRSCRSGWTPWRRICRPLSAEALTGGPHAPRVAS